MNAIYFEFLRRLSAHEGAFAVAAGTASRPRPQVGAQLDLAACKRPRNAWLHRVCVGSMGH
ncbi:MAG: hypothetical protein K2W33_11380, partial [Burkholderiales bacterium]|nr:hypothetical protein [Burkholderiales bacterium]